MGIVISIYQKQGQNNTPVKSYSMAASNSSLKFSARTMYTVFIAIPYQLNKDSIARIEANVKHFGGAS